MKTALKIAAVSAMLALTANATPGNKKQNNYYKASITGNVLTQDDGDYNKEKLTTNDVIAAILSAKGLNWNVKKCDLVMELSTKEDPFDGLQFWIYYKSGKDAMKVNVTGPAINVAKPDYVAYKIKWTGKKDNKKATSEFTEGVLAIDADWIDLWVKLNGTADVTTKGWVKEEAPFLNNAKFRTTGYGATDGGAPVKLDFKVKGRIKNAAFEKASSIMPAS